MSIDPYHPTLDENPHSPLPVKPDPLGPGQAEPTLPRVPGEERGPTPAPLPPLEREQGGAERVIGAAQPAERGTPPGAR
jgi:hypothetical protein